MVPGRAKRIAFTLVAVVGLPLALFGALELVLRAARFGFDPSFFVERTIDGERVVTDNPRFGWRFFPPEIARSSQPISFARHKAAGTARVFVLGGSAAMGDPVPSAGLPRVLQAMLEECRPDLRIEVVNAAMTAINSHVVLPIARECLDREPDALVVYLGNNEVVGPFGAGSVFGIPGAGWRVARARTALAATRTGQLLDRIVRAARSAGRDRPEVWAGMEMFLGSRLARDDPRLNVVYESFRRNLADLCDAAAARGVPVVVSTVGVNLRSCAPFASVGEEEERADRHWDFGHELLAMGETRRAAEELVLARDLDALRFRADTGIDRAVRGACEGRESDGVLLVDAAGAMSAASPAGIPGHELFDDHVHPTFAGNWEIARAIVPALLPALRPPPEGEVGPSRIPDADACASRIACGPWTRHGIVELMRQRRLLMPFAAQSDAAEWRARIDVELEKLSAETQPQHLRRALANARAQLDRHPEDWTLRQDVASLMQQTGDGRGAVRERRLLAGRFPYRAGTIFELAETLAAVGEEDEAIAAYRRAIAVDSRHFLARNRLGEELLDDGAVEEALAQFEAAVAIDPRFARAHKNRGSALLRLGRPAAAEAALRVAIERNPELPTAHKRLGDALAEQGRTAEAAEAYRAALRLHPGYQAAQEKLDGLGGG